MDSKVERIVQQAMNGAQQPQIVQQMTPFNDCQLIAMMAGNRSRGNHAVAVKECMEIVAETVVQMGPNGEGLAKLIQAKQALKQ